MEPNKQNAPTQGQKIENQEVKKLEEKSAVSVKLTMAKEYVAYKKYQEENGITNQSESGEPLFGKLKTNQSLLDYKLGRIDSVENNIRKSVRDHVSKRYRRWQLALLGGYVVLTALLILAGWAAHAYEAPARETFALSGIVHGLFCFVIWGILTAFVWKQFNVLHREHEERLNEYYKVLYELNLERFKLLN